MKLSCDMRDDRNKLTNHMIAISSLELKLSTEHETMDGNAVSATKDLILKIFSRNRASLNIPHRVLHLDHEYWCWDLIVHLLSACCSIYGTIKRMP